MIHRPPAWNDRLLSFWFRRRLRGFFTLRRIIARGTHGDAIHAVTNYGSHFLLKPNAYIDSIVIREGYYESEVLHALRGTAGAGSVIWDVGANFGLHAATLGRLAPETTIVAFEPNPAEHARLLVHRAWNAPALVTSSLALSDAASVSPLFLGPEGNSGMTTLSPWSQAAYTGSVGVATALGDELVHRGSFPAPNAIKLDVEGHELSVLRGLSETLRRPACQLVVFEDNLEPSSAAKSLLHAAGFSIQPLSRLEKTDHTLANFIARKNATGA